MISNIEEYSASSSEEREVIFVNGTAFALRRKPSYLAERHARDLASFYPSSESITSITTATQILERTKGLLIDSASQIGSTGDLSLYIGSLIRSQLVQIFTNAVSEVFEDGEVSDFEHRLRTFLVRYRELGFNILEETLSNFARFPHVVAETLEILARIDELEPYSRLQLIGTYLSDKRLAIRDASLCALEYLGDSKAIPVLRRAIVLETNAFLRTQMTRTIRELEQNYALSAAKN